MAKQRPARWPPAGPTPALPSVEDVSIPVCVDTADDAIAPLREHHSRWKS